MMKARGGILMTMHRMSQGGADRVAVLLANGFQAAGIPTDFLLLRRGGEGEGTLLRLLDPSVRVYYAGAPMGSRHLELVRGVHAIRSTVASARPSLVLASSSNMGLVTGIACKSLRQDGVAVAMKLTNPVIRPRDWLAFQQAYRKRLYRFIFSRHDRILTLTDVEKAALEASYPELSGRFVTVPNAYISGDHNFRGRKPRTRKIAPRLITLARMMPQKRLDVLLHAFAQLKRKDARLTILGDGPLRASLEELAVKLGIADRLEAPGFVEDVAPALRAADLFVLSSDYEGLPAAVLEALACEVPVVTTDCFPGARRMLERYPSCAVTPIGDSVALARAIDEKLTFPPVTGLSKIAADYTIDASIRAHIDVLQATMDRR